MLIETIKLCPILVIIITKIITLIIVRPKNRILIDVDQNRLIKLRSPLKCFIKSKYDDNLINDNARL